MISLLKSFFVSLLRDTVTSSAVHSAPDRSLQVIVTIRDIVLLFGKDTYVSRWKHSLCNSQKLEFCNVFNDSYTPSIFLMLQGKILIEKHLWNLCMQWNLCNTDTEGTEQSARIKVGEKVTLWWRHLLASTVFSITHDVVYICYWPSVRSTWLDIADQVLF